MAPLGELARCSRFDGAYQRNLIETHRSEIEQFLADRQFLFFPEVVLSASLSFDYKRAGKREVRPLGDLFTGKGFASSVDGLSVRVAKTKLPKGLEVVGGSAAPTLAYLDIPEAQLTREDGLRLFRIDGNHRLSAARDLQRGDATYGLETPFCIVLHEDPTEKQRFEKVVFHNINAKQIPLTSEENLRLILQDGPGALFSDEGLLTQPSFGPAYWLARRLLPQFNADFLGALAKHFEHKHTLALGLAQFLMAKQAVASAPDAARLQGEVDRIRQALIDVNTHYAAPSGQALRASGCHGVLTAFVYFALKNGGRQWPALARWIETNRIDRLSPATTTRGLGYHYHLGRTQAVDAASLVDVFESVLTARQRQIFISMAFREETKETFETIKKTVRQINERHQLDILLREIRIDQFNKGHSHTIDDEILKVIEGCGLLIADLTFGNRNVYHEIGYLMGLNRGKGQGQDNFILIADKKTRGAELESDIGFNLKSWQQLRFESTWQLEEALTESIEIFYRLRGGGARAMDPATLSALRDRHPAWRLLASRHAPLVASFLHRVFVAPTVRVMSEADLAEALEDGLFALREPLGPQAYPQGAQDILLSTTDPSVVATRLNKDYIKSYQVAGQTMRYSSQVKPISYLKANAAEVLAQLTERREPLVITQNGEAKAVIQDVASYEETQETLALLKILALGNAQIEVGKVKPAREVVARLRAK